MFRKKMKTMVLTVDDHHNRATDGSSATINTTKTKWKIESIIESGNGWSMFPVKAKQFMMVKMRLSLQFKGFVLQLQREGDWYFHFCLIFETLYEF